MADTADITGVGWIVIKFVCKINKICVQNKMLLNFMYKLTYYPIYDAIYFNYSYVTM